MRAYRDLEPKPAHDDALELARFRRRIKPSILASYDAEAISTTLWASGVVGFVLVSILILCATR